MNLLRISPQPRPRANSRQTQRGTSRFERAATWPFRKTWQAANWAINLPVRATKATYYGVSNIFSGGRPASQNPRFTLQNPQPITTPQSRQRQAHQLPAANSGRPWKLITRVSALAGSITSVVIWANNKWNLIERGSAWLGNLFKQPVNNAKNASENN
jgi:hypothetical protein